MTRERPILFSGPMVRALLEGRKDVTRRVVTRGTSDPCGLPWDALDLDRAFPNRGMRGPDTHYLSAPWKASALEAVGGVEDTTHRIYPRISAGDRLWVRETWGGDNCCGYAYRADHPDWKHFEGDGEQPDSHWRPSIFMPRDACRLELDVVSVRAERLQEITAEEACREGVTQHCQEHAPYSGCLAAFRDLWDRINGKRPGCSWADSPWVWRVEVRRVGP